MELMRATANRKLDPSHKLDEATFKATCQDDDPDQRRMSDRLEIGAGGEKQRDDNKFKRAVAEAFKAFRDHERDIVLDAPAGFQVASSRSDERADGKWWLGAAHLRHHVEVFLVLKGIRPCLLFHKYSPDNCALFITVVIDCLVPIMVRLDLWSYGCGISFQTGYWVFYDARSGSMSLVDKICLTHHMIKEKDPNAYPTVNKHRLVATALGYPVPFDDFPSDRWIYILDNTERDVLISKGQPEPRHCVQAMEFGCPVGGLNEWAKVVSYFDACEQVARSAGTELELRTDHHPEIKCLMDNIQGMVEMNEEFEAMGVLQHQDDNGTPVRSGPRVGGTLEKVEWILEVLDRLAAGAGRQEQDGDDENSGDHV